MAMYFYSQGNLNLNLNADNILYTLYVTNSRNRLLTQMLQNTFEGNRKPNVKEEVEFMGGVGEQDAALETETPQT